MSGLPSFFHQKGKTVLDELADYELGGDSDEEIDGIIDDTGFDDGYGGSDLELPSFFQPTTRPSDQLSNIGNVSTVDSDGSLLNSDSVNLSSLLNNFAWLGKDVGPQSASPAQKSDSAFLNGLPSSNLSASKQNNVLAPPGVAPNPMPTPQSMSPQKYSEILAQNDRAPLDRQSSIPFPGQLQQYVMPPLGPDGSSRMNMSSNGMPLVTPYAMPMPMPMPMQMHHSQPPYPPSFRGPPSHFVNGPNGPMPPPPNMHFYHHPPNFPQQSPLHPMQQQQQQQQQQHQFEVPFRSSTEVSRGPPSADPRLNTTGPRDQTPTFQEPQEMLQQMLQQLQQPPPPSTPPPVQSSILQRLAVDPNVDARMHHAPPVDRGRTQMFQQMAVTTAGPGITPSAGYPKSEMMTSSDVRFVVNKVVSPLETNDPYSEDYYFLQSNYKKNAKKAEAAMLAGEPIPHPVYLPFPAWLETKNRIASHLEDKRKLFGDRSREWEEKEQVLGHMQRTDVNRPKEQLHVPTLQDMLDMDSEMDGDTVFRMPFVSRLWNMRQAVQKGYEALYTLQELNHLLLSPLIVGNPPARGEILQQIDRAVSLLSQSVGIRPAHEGLLRPQGPGSQPEISLEGGLVAAILQTAKGKKLMSRSINLLIPEQRWALLPVILARVLQSDPSEQSSDEQAVEKKLLHTLTLFIEHSHEYQKNQQALVSSVGGCAPFTSMLLGNLRLCVKSVMVSQMEKSRLRTTLKFSRDRAVVMNIIVQIGDEVAGQAAETISTEWIQMREAFMCMLDE